jgi:hypothetical protein
MWKWVRGIIPGVAALMLAATMSAQQGLPLPTPIEKQLAARASNVTEVTLGKSMLAFAAKFMNSKDKDEAQISRLIQGLDGIYVREYEFDKLGQFSAEDVESLRQHFETNEWSPLVRERDRRTGETTDVMVRLVNGQTGGMFILEAGPRELTIVLILGPIKVEDLGKLKGIAGLQSLGGIEKNVQKDGAQKGGK